MSILPKKLDADMLKRAIAPSDYYQSALQKMKPPKRFGWAEAGLCPFHDDTHAGSFRIHTNTGAFRCFSCGAKGADIIAFTMLRHGISFREALTKLALDWGVA
jgi:DNA primase